MKKQSYFVYKSASEYYIADNPDLTKARKIHHLKYDASIGKSIHMYTDPGMNGIWNVMPLT